MPYRVNSFQEDSTAVAEMSRNAWGIMGKAKLCQCNLLEKCSKNHCLLYLSYGSILKADIIDCLDCL